MKQKVFLVRGSFVATRCIRTSWKGAREKKEKSGQSTSGSVCRKRSMQGLSGLCPRRGGNNEENKKRRENRKEGEEEEEGEGGSQSSVIGCKQTHSEQRSGDARINWRATHSFSSLSSCLDPIGVGDETRVLELAAGEKGRRRVAGSVSRLLCQRSGGIQTAQRDFHAGSRLHRGRRVGNV